jgi:hypothetical protein
VTLFKPPVILLMMLAATTALVAAAVPWISEIDLRQAARAGAVLGALTTAFLAYLAIAGYLNTDSGVSNASLTTLSLEADLLPRVQDVERQIAKLIDVQKEAELSNLVLSSSEKEELKQAVVERLHQHEMKAALLEVEEKIQREHQQATVVGLKQLYDGLVISLEKEISNLGRRANLNLAMGTVVTALGLFILAYFVFFTTHSSLQENVDIIIYYGIRLTLVVFIEVFAYFFLRLYRYGLFETKYFQNEITTARFKIVALEVCLNNGSKEMIDRLCMELVKTERNFILKKGETTLSLRRDELEQRNDITMTKLIEHLLDARKTTETDRNKLSDS